MKICKGTYMTIISGYWKGWSKSRPLVGTKSILIPVPVVSCGIPTPYTVQQIPT